MIAGVFFAFACFVAGSTAQINFDGPCQNVTTQQNFDIQQYLGFWYEIKRYEAIFELGGECATANYTLVNSQVQVNNTYINALGKRQSIIGQAREANPQLHDGKLKVIFPSVGSPEGDYWVLGTDYKNYSVVWACVQLGPFKNFQFAWVLSRTPVLTADINNTVGNILTRNKVDQTKFRPTKQDEKTCGVRKSRASTEDLSD